MLVVTMGWCQGCPPGSALVSRWRAMGRNQCYGPGRVGAADELADKDLDQQLPEHRFSPRTPKGHLLAGHLSTCCCWKSHWIPAGSTSWKSLVPSQHWGPGRCRRPIGTETGSALGGCSAQSWFLVLSAAVILPSLFEGKQRLNLGGR